jgi:hypothetical protein
MLGAFVVRDDFHSGLGLDGKVGVSRIQLQDRGSPLMAVCALFVQVGGSGRLGTWGGWK